MLTRLHRYIRDTDSYGNVQVTVDAIDQAYEELSSLEDHLKEPFNSLSSSQVQPVLDLCVAYLMPALLKNCSVREFLDAIRDRYGMEEIEKTVDLMTAEIAEAKKRERELYGEPADLDDHPF
jgi:hypothetical protein